MLAARGFVRRVLWLTLLRAMAAAADGRLLQQQANSNATGSNEAGGATPLVTTTEAPVFVTNVSESEYVCGAYEQDCHIAAHIPFGPDIWLRTTFTYAADGSYIREELSYFNQTACKHKDAWLQLTYEGRWRDAGIASMVAPKISLVATDVLSVWMKLFYDTVCVDGVDGGIRCLKTNETMQAICPCNGWSWTSGEQPRKRNIGMFCMPEAQCPIVHEAYLHQTHYVSYTANVGQACFSPASSSAERGWERPEELSCMPKVAPSRCSGPIAAAPRRHGSATAAAVLPLLLAAAFTAAG